jgi:hypothetical protein
MPRAPMIQGDAQARGLPVARVVSEGGASKYMYGATASVARRPPQGVRTSREMKRSSHAD